MAETDKEGGTAVAPELARMAAMMSGTLASAFDIAAAGLQASVRQARWLEARGLDDRATRSALDARAAAAAAHVDNMFNRFGLAVATPIATDETIAVSGRVIEKGIGRKGLEVVAVDASEGRRGKAVGQVTTGPAGEFSIRLEQEGDVLLMVTDDHGRTLMVDDRPVPARHGEPAFREIELGAAKKPPVRDRADLTGYVEMPELSGMNLADATDKLRDAGLKAIEVTINPKPEAEGVVLHSDPEPGSLIDATRPVEVVIGKDPEARFDRDVVSAVVKAETGEAVADEAVDRMFDNLAAKGVTGFDRLNSVARRDDKSFAEATGLAGDEAASARKSLLKAMSRLGTLKDREG